MINKRSRDHDTNPSEFLVSSDVKSAKNLTFHNFLFPAQHGYLHCDRAFTLNFNTKLFALRDIKMAAGESPRIRNG